MISSEAIGNVPSSSICLTHWAISARGEKHIYESISFNQASSQFLVAYAIRKEISYLNTQRSERHLQESIISQPLQYVTCDQI